MGWKDRIFSKGGRRLFAGANFIVYTAVVIAMVVLVNWFVDRHNRRWDLTANQRYSLSAQTLKILKGLDRNVNIYVFDRERSLRERRDLLDNYGVATKRVSVQYVDLDRQPTLAKQFGVREYGTLVVAAGDRHFEAQSPTEEGVTNALVRVLKGQKTTYFTQGHGERDLDNSERSGYSKIKKQLENENHLVQTVVLMQKGQVPADCSLLVIAGPRNDCEQPEIDTLKKYVQGGGRVLVLLDPGTEFSNLTTMLADWNVTLHNDLVIDQNPIAQLFGAEPTMPIIMKYGSSPIVQPLARTATLFPFCRSVAVGKEYKPGASAESLAETSSDSFGVADFNPKTRQVSYRAGKDFKGPLSVAVAGTVAGEAERKTEGRFVVLGTSGIAANAFFEFQGNRDLLMNMVNWLSADEDLISIRPKPRESQQLNLNAKQMRSFLVFGVLGLPLLIVGLGVGVWWRRR